MKIALSLVFVYLLVNCINLVNQEMRLQNYQTRLDDDMQKVVSEQVKLKEDLKIAVGEEAEENNKKILDISS